MTSHGAQTAVAPALFRAGDIGVSSEWRDITYDWAPVLTADGVFIYSYLRDMFDNQRILRPFILDPDGPTKQRIQRVLGRRTSWAIRGPEYLLATVGLVHIEVQYGMSSDADRPKHTATAYYVVGRLDHPVLDWSMLERVLDALLPALEPPSSDPETATRQKDAQAALRSLAQAGMLQNIDPEDLFDPDGAWPGLLPTLVQDDRWARLFRYLHTVDAVQPYRRQVRAWVEWAQRRAARALRENRAIADQLLAAQRRGQRGGHNNPPVGNSTLQQGGSIVKDSGTTGSEGTGVTQIPAVPELSRLSPRGIGVNQIPPGTAAERSQPDEFQEYLQGGPGMSPNQESINVCSMYESESTLSIPGTASLPGDRAEAGDLDHIPPVAPHLRDDELTSRRLDTYFWRAVQQILDGDDQRYNHTDGEKKAARRLANKTGAPIGVLLAALRAVMTLAPPQRPQRFGDALKLDAYHACVQCALALLPVRAQAAAAVSSWPQFLQAYRRLGQPNCLRDVSASDYHVLHALFMKQPNECWEVLNRVEHAAQLPDLSPAYLRQAIVNNQRAVAQRALLPIEQRATCGRVAGDSGGVQLAALERRLSLSDDPRLELLKREGVSADIVTDDMTEDYIREWVSEADARRNEIYSRPNWLKWGIESGYAPSEHPQLRPRSKRSALPAQNGQSRATPDASSSLREREVDTRVDAIWQAALRVLEVQLPRNELDTWIKPCRLVALEQGVTSGAPTSAIVATPNIFVRQEVEVRFQGTITAALAIQLEQAVEVQCVIAARY